MVMNLQQLMAYVRTISAIDTKPPKKRRIRVPTSKIKSMFGKLDGPVIIPRGNRPIGANAGHRAAATANNTRALAAYFTLPVETKEDVERLLFEYARATGAPCAQTDFARRSPGRKKNSINRGFAALEAVAEQMKKLPPKLRTVAEACRRLTDKKKKGQFSTLTPKSLTALYNKQRRSFKKLRGYEHESPEHRAEIEKQKRYNKAMDRLVRRELARPQSKRLLGE